MDVLAVNFKSLGMFFFFHLVSVFIYMYTSEIVEKPIKGVGTVA